MASDSSNNRGGYFLSSGGSIIVVVENAAWDGSGGQVEVLKKLHQRWLFNRVRFSISAAHQEWLINRAGTTTIHVPIQKNSMLLIQAELTMFN